MSNLIKEVMSSNEIVVSDRFRINNLLRNMQLRVLHYTKSPEYVSIRVNKSKVDGEHYLKIPVNLLTKEELESI